ncbi:MAG: phenylacetate-CoA oxygenase subunit PaaJ [Rhodoferax sp.]|nr:phenylacetate-CoA oxygenase subunit PaaJ [Rhodoferax sp.]
MQADVTSSAAQPVPSALPDGPIALKTPTDAHYTTWSLLESVTDPEIPVVNLREMGILRAVRQTATGLEVVITPTYSGCPAMSQMQDDVVNALSKAGVAARVLTQIAPAWSTDWMTPEAREKLRAYGIAPPHPSGCGTPVANVIQFASKKTAGGAEPAVACPQCGSLNTTETSHFGSTACKALYRCLNCLEPFDYFKPY